MFFVCCSNPVMGGQLGVVDENTMVVERPDVNVPVLPVPPPEVEPPVADVSGSSAGGAVPYFTMDTNEAVASILAGSESMAGRPARSGVSNGSGGDVSSSDRFSGFVAAASSKQEGGLTPMQLLVSIRKLDGERKQQAIIYMEKILANPMVPESDKVLFRAIRNQMGQ